MLVSTVETGERTIKRENGEIRLLSMGWDLRQRGVQEDPRFKRSLDLTITILW